MAVPTASTTPTGSPGRRAGSRCSRATRVSTVPASLAMPTRFIQLEHPIPWLSDISFDGNDLVLGFRDSLGDRTGNDVRSPNISATSATAHAELCRGQLRCQTYDSNNGNLAGPGTGPRPQDDGNAPSWQATSRFHQRQQLPAPAAGRQQFGAALGSSDPSARPPARLSFVYRRVSLENSSDKVTVEISTDGGTTWTTVVTLAGPANDPAYPPAYTTSASAPTRSCASPPAQRWTPTTRSGSTRSGSPTAHRTGCHSMSTAQARDPVAPMTAQASATCCARAGTAAAGRWRTTAPAAA